MTGHNFSCSPALSSVLREKEVLFLEFASLSADHHGKDGAGKEAASSLKHISNKIVCFMFFFQRGNADGQQAHEKLLNITSRKCKSKPTMRNHLTPVRMTIIKKNTTNKYW